MNIAEAIRILEGELHRPLKWQNRPDNEAINLGIEALKWRLQIEQEDPDITLEPLPGETEK